MKKPDIDALLEKYRQGECTPEELDFLESWYLNYNKDADALTEEELMAEADLLSQGLQEHLPHVQRPMLTRRLRIPVGIAASLLMVLGVGLYVHLKNKKKTDLPTMAAIVPGHRAASLTLANGQKILLAEQPTGQIAQQAGVSVTKTAQGAILYQVNAENTAIGNNTLSTANGETYSVNLPDGSAVWLNAASSLTYPVAFGKTGPRSVTLTGEGYFEVAKDSAHPFIVHSGGQQVEVLGTHFNINAYKDEPLIRTTLLEGSVRITKTSTGSSLLLTPGEQAWFGTNGLNSAKTDTRAAIAWKEGYFRFKRESMETIMRRVARWYNVEVVYQTSLPEDQYSGTATRYGDIGQVLAMMEGSNGIHFTIKGRRVIVSK